MRSTKPVPTLAQAALRTMNPTTRRAFLGRLAGLGAAGAGAGWALNLASIGEAAAQSTEDYRALVCVFLTGGMDNCNTLVPMDTASYNTYAAARSTAPTPIALSRDSLQEIRPRTALPDGRQIGMPTQLAALKTLFDQGKAAIVANVGPLVVPTTLAQYQAQSVPLPPKLFSHNDQQSVWQALAAEGATTGWGGRLGDLMLSRNASSVFTCISTSGTSVWSSGNQAVQFQVSGNEAITVSITGLSQNLLFGSNQAPATLRELITTSGSGGSTALMQTDHAQVVQRSIDANASLSAALAAAPALTTVFPSNALADQLKAVARIIAARGGIGARRQTFYVSLGGFDHHDNLADSLPGLHATLAPSLAAFHAATVEMGLADKITLFTASDFGRTLTSNGDGSDHGWGSHQFVIGGAVRGGDIYGSMPRTALNTPEDVGQGRLLPAIAVDQYAATLATWFGVSATDLNTVLPNLANFSNRNLGFMV